ncbi:phosphoglycerate mutase 2 [Rhizophlyctis rosea]|nr:phosphoglycerate mutase 2 [Rhizophlyctis rosea]
MSTPTEPYTLTLVRHGATEWSESGQHTGSRTDLPLTDLGTHQATLLATHLKTVLKKDGCASLADKYTHVFCSPLLRARQTCDIVLDGAGRGDLEVVTDRDLVEWDYGDFEGKTSATIHSTPGHESWNLFKDGCPNGETVENVQTRTRSFLARLNGTLACTPINKDKPANILVFAHSHLLRVLAATFLSPRLPCADGAQLILSTASFSELSFEHGRLDTPCINVWNSTTHIDIDKYYKDHLKG